MGSSGGIIISTISSIREKWLDIRNIIIDCYLRGGNRNDYYIGKYLEASKLPKDINELDNDKLIELLSSFIGNRDTPCLIDDDRLILSSGGNVDSVVGDINDRIGGHYIETWS